MKNILLKLTCALFLLSAVPTQLRADRDASYFSWFHHLSPMDKVVVCAGTIVACAPFYFLLAHAYACGWENSMRGADTCTKGDECPFNY